MTKGELKEKEDLEIKYLYLKDKIAKLRMFKSGRAMMDIQDIQCEIRKIKAKLGAYNGSRESFKED